MSASRAAGRGGYLWSSIVMLLDLSLHVGYGYNIQIC